jgi:hypothetical protein
MENTRQLDKLLCLSTGVTRAPADNFWELKSNIAMFMALMWVLFGLECDYYKGLRNVYATLELKEVMAQKTGFTAEHCRRIMWAILDDECTHFDDVKTTLDFRGPDKPVFPQLFLIDILRNVRYAIPVERANFPEEWKRKARTTTDDQGECTSGGGSSPLRGTNRPTSQGTDQGMITPRQDFGTPQGYGGGGGHGQYVPIAQGRWWPSYQGGAYQGGQYQGGYFSLTTNHPQLAHGVEQKMSPKNQISHARLLGAHQWTNSP